LAAAVLIREKIILSGDTQDIPSPDVWASPLRGRKKAETSAVNS
jgi:hypothetical protein